MTEKPTPKRRWFRFSLRTLLIVVVVLSLPLGWLALKMRQAERQRQAVAAIHRAAGSVVYDYQYSKSGTLTLQAEPPVPTWLTELLGVDLFADVVRVNFFTLRATDAGLEHRTDAALEHLKGLTSLESLELCNTQVTDAGLEHLKGHTRLKSLTFAMFETHVTWEGIRELNKDLPNCRIGRLICYRKSGFPRQAPTILSVDGAISKPNPER